MKLKVFNLVEFIILISFVILIYFSGISSSKKQLTKESATQEITP